MILTMDAGKSLFIKFVWFVVFFFSGKSLPPLPRPPAEKELSVNWEAELLNKKLLKPDFARCVHFTVCYPGVIS